MILPVKQIVLFRELLEGFKLKAEVEDRVLAEIYAYLFTPSGNPPLFSNPDIQDMAEALKSIVEMEHLLSLESIIRFFEIEDREIDSWMEEIIEETERAQAEMDKATEEMDEFIGTGVQTVAMRPALSRFYICSDDHGPQVFVETYNKYKDDLLEYVCDQLQSDLSEDLVTPEDIVQDTLLDVWSVLQQSEGWTMGSVKSLFWLTARHLCQEVCARRQRELTISTTKYLHEPAETFDIVVNLEIRDQLSQLVRMLDPMTLRVYELRTTGHSAHAISKELGITFFAATKLVTKLNRWVGERKGDVE